MVLNELSYMFYMDLNGLKGWNLIQKMNDLNQLVLYDQDLNQYVLNHFKGYKYDCPPAVQAQFISSVL